MPADRYDTLVIGAGLSGLAAGIRLAQFGQRVAVLERHYLWGGLNSFFKRRGRRLDVGLHALTNFVQKGDPSRPLNRVLRQLRLRRGDLQLGEQRESWVVFPQTRLRFSNDFELLRSEVHAAFPDQAEGFDRLAADILALEHGITEPTTPSRKILGSYIDDPLLVDMLLHPILWYGSPTPDDVEWPSFVVLWKSLYEEGFARPAGGVKPFLDALRSRYLEEGGELRMRQGVADILHGPSGVRGVRLDDGTELEADRVLSSAGWVETMRLCGGELADRHGEAEAGRMSFVETTTLLDRLPSDLGYEATIAFYNLAPGTLYAPPEGAVDVRSGVVCCPDNYEGQEPVKEGTFRVTVLANPDIWRTLPDEEYYARKEAVWGETLDAVRTFAPDVRPHVTYTDVFTPRTIEHWTGHVNGAVYGSPEKRRDGRTPVPGLFLTGTDQGYLGIVGALQSGISMANLHGLLSPA